MDVINANGNIQKISNDSVHKKKQAICVLKSQLGNLFYEKEYELCKDKFPEVMDKIIFLEKKIEEDKRIMEERKKERRCIKCGGNVPQEAKFCNHCGALLGGQNEQVRKRFCVICGNTLEPDSIFCIECGTRIK